MLHTEQIVPLHSFPQIWQFRFSFSSAALMILDIFRIEWYILFLIPLRWSSSEFRKIKTLSEIYESEIVFYAFTNNLPFQSEPCPHMNEGIRTEIREFLNSLEEHRSGIKNNMYHSILKISNIVKATDEKEKRNCQICGNECSGTICSVCNMISNLKNDWS